MTARTFTCCEKYQREVNIRRSNMVERARKAARFGDTRPKLIEDANQAKAAYIKARANLLEHVAGCVEDKP